jgi:hypothetical protein
MTTKEELKLLFQQYRWAAEELACDQKMQELNALANAHPRHLYDYLHHSFGSNAAVLAAMRDIIRWQDSRRKTLRKER